MLRRLEHAIRRAAGLPPERRRLALEAVFWLLLARVAVGLPRFGQLDWWLGRMTAPVRDTPSHAPHAEQIALIRHSVRHVADAMPFAVVCLPRALAAWQMLKRRQIPVRAHFGADRVHGMQAPLHAWVTAEGLEVSGFPEAADCVEIGVYVFPADHHKGQPGS